LTTLCRSALRLAACLACACALVAPLAAAAQKPTLNVGSKRFTESYIVAEIVTRVLRDIGDVDAVHRPGLGNTAVVYSALRSGAIDVYPEYTGTIAYELLGLQHAPNLQALDARLAPYGVAAGIPLGFSNSYGLAMPARLAARLGIVRLSQLQEHPELRYRLSPEFLNRKDGWPGLAAAYGLAAAKVTALEHGLAYEAVKAGEADVIDVYTTDPKIDAYGLRVLVDDRNYFPSYDAVLLYRSELPRRYPKAWAALKSLEGELTPVRIRALNAEVELGGKSYQAAAADFLGSAQLPAPARSFGDRVRDATFAPDFWRLTREHLLLVLVSLACSTAIGVPLGWIAHGAPAARYSILGAVGILQTVPALALLAFLIALLDRIGTVPALIALALYAQLPIVRNTQTGLDGVPGGLKQAATALGFTPAARVRLVDLPLAAPTILAGIRTAAVINVGTATIAAFVGAGGYGERIVAGLPVHDSALLVAGAAPAAALAVLLEGLFHIADRLLPGRARRSRR
jgi:osmoprotectant transport system permease protein